MLPPFDSNGNLPHGDTGIHNPTFEEFADRFVLNFPESETRKDIYDGWCGYVQKLLNLGIKGTQWADGSYLTNKTNPNDLDIVNLIDGYLINSLPQDIKNFLKNVMLQEKPAKKEYKCHPFLVPLFPKSKPDLYNFTIDGLNYWKRFFGTDRDGNLKGIIEFEINEKSYPVKICDREPDEEDA